MTRNLLSPADAAQKIWEVSQGVRVTSEEDWARLTFKEKCIWDIPWYFLLVANGGQRAFFRSEQADHTAFLIDALGTIGATLTQRVLMKACQIFPGNWPDPDYDKRQAQMETLIRKAQPADPWEYDTSTFDESGVEVEGEKENLYGLLWSYLENDPQETR
jgi:hypothetical protein